MELMTSGRTSERLDDLKGQVDDLSRRMDTGFGELREQMQAQCQEANVRFDAINARFDSLQRTMIQFGAVVIAALVGLLATQLGLILTQL